MDGNNLDVLLNRCAGLRPGLEVLLMYPLVFQTAPEAQDGSTIITIPLSRQGGDQTLLLENSAVGLGAILASPVRVVAMDWLLWQRERQSAPS